MTLTQLTTPEELANYNQWLHSQAAGNFWQSAERKNYIDSLGKEARIFAWKERDEIDTAALVMIDRTSFSLSTWDIPRGPVGQHREELLSEILQRAEKEKVMSVYFSPLSQLSVCPEKSRKSSRHIHAEATRIVDLNLSEEEILAQMKQKGRYNISVAEKHGVTVARSTDVSAFYALLKETSSRDQFTGLSEATYKAFLESLEQSFLLLAYDTQKKPIAGLIGVMWGETGIYYYGASSYAHRQLMAPYLLQWEAMQLCKQQGCTTYDLLGIAPMNSEANHPWQGITVFKDKFGGVVREYPAEQEIILKPFVRTLLNMKRKMIR